MSARPWQIHAGGQQLPAGDPACEPPGWENRSAEVSVDAGPPGSAKSRRCIDDRVSVRREYGSTPVRREAFEAHSQQWRPLCEPCLPRADRAIGNSAEQVRNRFRAVSTRCGR